MCRLHWPRVNIVSMYLWQEFFRPICLKKIRRKSHYNGYFNKEILLMAEGELTVSAHSKSPMLKAGEILGKCI